MEAQMRRDERVTDEMVCPDCGRPIAKNAGDAARGDCPKWWAIRDEMAEKDCTRYAGQPRMSRDLLGKIIDDVFDGAIEDASVIEEIYASIIRHSALSAALSEKTQPVRVKALEWSLIYSSDDETAWSAMAIGGVYTVRQLTNTGGAWLHCVRTEKRYPSVEAAKAAAQQDFETRIRSAIVDVPVEPVAEAGEMPGSNGGFTMAAFRASDVPIGTKLYTTPLSTRTASTADGSATLSKGLADE
jgi:hypothetical protein